MNAFNSLITLALILVLTPIAFTAHAEPLVERAYAIGDINHIKLSGSGWLELRQGEQDALEIVARESVIDHIQVDAVGAVLRIRPDQTLLQELQMPITYRITAKHLAALNLSGAVKGKSFGEVRFDDLVLKTSGSVNMTFEDIHVKNALNITTSGAGYLAFKNLEAKQVKGHLSGAGITTMAGVAGSQTLSVSGAGRVNSEQLKVDLATLKLSGAVKASVWAERQLNVKASGVSHLTYFGKPMMQKKASGFSTIIHGGSSPDPVQATTSSASTASVQAVP